MENLNAKQIYELVDSLINMEAFQNSFSERPFLTSHFMINTEGVWSSDFTDESEEWQDVPGKIYVDYLTKYITFTSDLIFLRFKILSIPFLVFQEVLEADDEGIVLKGTEEEVKYFNKAISEDESFNKE